MIGQRRMSDSLILWLIAMPGILYFIIFKYIPLLGNVLAFQDYSLFLGVFQSPWVGFAHFEKMFTYHEFFTILRNTLALSFYSIVFGFPAPLVLALFLNEVRLTWLKKWVQTLLYLPHFLSWIIVGGIFINLLEKYFTDSNTFVGTIVAIGIWKEVGWGMIIYLAALAGVNPHLYEAAMVDGANRWRRMWSVSLPALMPAIVVLFLMRIGNVLDANIEQILVFLNPLVRDVGEVIDTYVYRVGLQTGQFSYTTAIGISKSLVGFLLIVGLNRLSKRITGESIY